MTVLATDPRVVSLVEKLARRHCGSGVNFDELRSAGLFAAFEASKRYDPSKGTPTAFAYRRINGAIRDAARHDCSAIDTPRKCEPKCLIGDSQRDDQESLGDLICDHRGDHQPDIWAMVAELDDHQAEVLRMRFDGAGLSLEDSAEVLGWTIDEVKNIEASALDVLERRLDDLDYPVAHSDEEMTMSRVNGFHVPEPTTASADVSDRHCCPSCDQPYKTKTRRCYNRSCPASGWHEATPKAPPKTKGKTAKASKRAPSTRVESNTVTNNEGIRGTPTLPQSFADELQIMSLMTGLLPAARKRVLAWISSAFGA